MIRRPPRSTQGVSSAASDVYKRQVMDDNFLKYSKSQGNDLITPMPIYSFPGLKDGDHWCICLDRLSLIHI